MEREEGYEMANGEWEGRMQDLKKSRWKNQKHGIQKKELKKKEREK